MEYEIKRTAYFNNWLKKLKDRVAVARILSRLFRVEKGNFGDHKSITRVLSELRFFFGPGYRIYFTIQNGNVVLLLFGGDKSSQEEDIATAKKILDEQE